MEEEKKIVKELLFGMYSDNIAQCRHNETQRAIVTSSIIAIETVIIGLITIGKEINWSDLPLCFLLVILGIFGCSFVIKHYERISLYTERARQYQKLLDREFGFNEILRIKYIADEIHDKSFPRLRKFRHHNFWFILHITITAIGIILTCLAIFTHQRPQPDIKYYKNGDCTSIGKCP